MKHAGEQLKARMIEETARLMSQQMPDVDHAHILKQAAQLVDQQIKQAIYADPLD